MTQAIEIFFAMWVEIFNSLFSQFYILPGVSVGFVLFAVIIILAIIQIVISRPKGGEEDE